jgi:aerobic carbon-monoxide dehydrogenase medium subunit
MPSSRILPEFELLLPESVAEAVKLLKKYKDQATVMAGGTDVIVSGTQGFATPYIISLAKIKGLDSVKFSATGGLRIGAMATLQMVADAKEVKKHYPALYKSTAINGTPQTRNMGTVMGNVMRASPSGDCGCALLALGAKIVFEGPRGKREVALDDFFIDYKKTDRKPDELAVEIKVPAPKAGVVSAFNRITRTTLDLSKINAAVCLTIERGVCKSARIAMGAVAPKTIRLYESENLLKGQKITPSVLEAIAATVGSQLSPIDDVRSTEAYRREVSPVLVRRTIQEALA